MTSNPPEIPQSATPNGESPPVARRRTLDRVLLFGGLGFVLAVLVLSPGDLLGKADHIGYAVCHQISVRSYFFGDHQLPLCARCSGQYLGALFGLVLLLILGRSKAAALPPTPIVVLLLGFLAVWAFDGLNSYLTFFPGLPHLYEPKNILRVTTGAMQGVALIALVWPFYNAGMWAHPSPQRSIRNWREVGLLALIIVAIVALVTSDIQQLLYPLALLSVGGTVMMLTIVNTMLVTIALRRSGTVERWRDALPLLAGGLALATLEIIAINVVRAWLTSKLGLPF
ncbi:MAG: DUF2085 domain-containing protein [Anaerolineae bacterium]|nr:DUF2085 domain-containing protein [Anaerolineae bacterium]